MSSAKTNSLGRSRADYVGGKSTLCTGCGHDTITNNIISALFLSGISPYKIAKLSGIGCSSKTPAYFLNQSHGFNSLHGRMAPLATGVKMANHHLTAFGISGDGDTASIGLGGFVHLIRRNLPMVYIIENNGVYGLTKGQFSATADKGSELKNGTKNPFSTLDLCSLALEAGCGFVARSFSGDAKQLVPLLEAALKHNGTAVIDIISPCVTFANHEGSTKSYTYVKDHKVALQELNFILPQEEILVDYKEGEDQAITLSDGSQLLLHKLESKNYDFTSSVNAINHLHQAKSEGKILTGLFYYDSNNNPLTEVKNLGDKALCLLNEQDTRMSEEDFNKELRQFC